MEYTLSQAERYREQDSELGRQTEPASYTDTLAHTPPPSPDRALSGVRGHGLDLGAARKQFTQSFII